ncbi:uncharacterized protein JCM6883_004151 [Sporobolomyces salmoneus]|uniref:uncharacterized protein n=1 Tax=Sporobolomyces salmoneus TaxID=183962 RepID=UPI00317BCA53
MLSIPFVLSLLSVAAAHSFERRAPATPIPSVYPNPGTKGPAPKQEWIDKYNEAKAAGRIPGDSPSSLDATGNIVYAPGVRTGPNGVCSWTVAHCFDTFDVSDAPDGMYGVSFDDGPTPNSPQLYDLLTANNQTATHFLIGTTILQNLDVFQQVVDSGGHLAVHTFSHSYMTTMTDEQLLGELGWTAQLIFDYSGLAPAYWRPPYGDVDNRVRAIAQEVFGLTTVIWNIDSDDWCLNEVGACPGYGPETLAGLEAELTKWQTGSKSPGVIGLEHESGPDTVAGFMNTFSGIKSNGWDARNIPDLWDALWYQNAEDNDDPNKNTSFVIGSGPFNTSAASVSMTSSSALPSSTSTSSSAPSSTQSGSMTSKSAQTATAAAQQETKNNKNTSFGIRLSLRDSSSVFVGIVALSVGALAIII